MVQLEVIVRAAEDHQHQVDTEGVCVHGDRVYTCDDVGKVKVWEQHNLKLLQEFQAHDYCTNDLLVLGNTLFTCSVDATIKSWDAATCQPRNPAVGTHEESIRKLATNGSSLFAGDDGGEVRVYSSEGLYEATHNMVEEVWGLLAQDDLIYTVRDRGLTISQTRGASNKSTVVTSLEGRAPLVVVGDNLICPDQSGFTLCVRDNTKGSYKVKGELKGHELIITAMAGKGQWLASTGWDNLVRLWDLGSLKQLASCELPGCANALAFSDDGYIFATGLGGYVCKLKAS